MTSRVRFYPVCDVKKMRAAFYFQVFREEADVFVPLEFHKTFKPFSFWYFEYIGFANRLTASISGLAFVLFLLHILNHDLLITNIISNKRTVGILHLKNVGISLYIFEISWYRPNEWSRNSCLKESELISILNRYGLKNVNQLVIFVVLLLLKPDIMFGNEILNLYVELLHSVIWILPV